MGQRAGRERGRSALECGCAGEEGQEGRLTISKEGAGTFQFNADFRWVLGEDDV